MILRAQLTQDQVDTAADAGMRPNWLAAAIAAVFGGADVVSLSGAAPPTSGVAGTGAGVAGPTSTYRDTTLTNGIPLYFNINTKASPTWAPVLLGDSV